MSDGEIQRQFTEQRETIASLQHEIRQIGRLGPAITEIRHSVARLDGVAEQTARLEEMAKQITSLHGRMDEHEKLLTRIYEQQVLNENMAQARAELARLRDRLDTEFAGRNDIRRLATSLISAAGTAAIRDHVIEAQTMIDVAGSHMAAEAQHWLGAVVVAVVSEHLGHESAGANAWAMASEGDAAKSDLFMALFYSLVGKDDAAAMSMNQYLGKLTPEALGHEFSHAINALAEGELGADARSYAHETLRRWDQAPGAPGSARTAFAEQFALCRNHLLVHGAPFPRRVPVLTRHVPDQDWQEIEDNWKFATACGSAAEDIAARFSEPAAEEGAAHRREHSRRALSALIRQPEPDEIVLLRQIRRQELILECGGNRTEALGREQALGDPWAPTHDLATFLTQAAFESEVYGLTPRARRFVLACARGWIMEAGRSVREEAARTRPRTVPIQWDGWLTAIDAEAPAQAESARLTDEVCGYIASVNRLRKPGRLSVFWFLAGILLPVGAAFAVRGAALWGMVAVGLVISAAVGLDVVTYPARRARRADEIAREQHRAAQTIPGLVADARTLLELWDGTAERGLAKLDRTLGAVAPAGDGRTRPL